MDFINIKVSWNDILKGKFKEKKENSVDKAQD